MGPWRVFVISDLHLGTLTPPMMSQPELLAKWIEELPKRCSTDEQLILVLAGDVIDFLAIPIPGTEETESWTPSPDRARQKLEAVMGGIHAPVFGALAKHLADGHELVVMLGNHDLELSIGEVQRRLCERLDVAPHQICFMDDGRPWRLGRLLVTHGNRYDRANINDLAYLREARSAWEHGIEPQSTMNGSLGSDLVQDVLNPLKKRYPWLDLLQPQGVILYYLLKELEPSLQLHLPMVWQVLRAISEQERSTGEEPGATWAISGRPDLTDRALQERVRRIFDEEQPKADGTAPVAGGRRWWAPKESDESLSKRVEELSEARLRRLQQRLTWLADGDGSLVVEDDPGIYGQAAERLRETLRMDTVVMGHTHHPRCVTGSDGRVTYINTGTWADYVHVPLSVREHTDPGGERLRRWLRDLVSDNGVRRCHPHWADVRVAPDGAVEHARLEAETPVPEQDWDQRNPE